MKKPAAISLESLHKNYNRAVSIWNKKQKSGIPAVDNVCLTLHEGEILGLIGESGSGKTTIGKSILKLMTIDDGKIKLFNKDITHLSEGKFRPFRKDIQMIFQDLDAALNPNMKIGNILSEIINRHHKSNKKETEKILLKLFSDVQLDPSILQRYPAELSGGQKRRIAIASALAVEPKVIIADEPTTGLDNYTQSLIMQLILKLQQSRNLSMILISHDLQLVKTMSQRVAIMYLGNIVELGPIDEVSESPAHPYSLLLWQSHLKHITQTPNQQKHDVRSGLFDFERPGEGCRFSPRCKRFTEMGKPDICTLEASKPVLTEVSESHLVACHFPLNQK